MPEPITITLANPAVDACPETFAEAINLIRTLLTAEIPDPFTPYVAGSGTPAVNQQSYIWFKTDTDGRPVGVYKFYSGAWRRVYNGSPGEIRIFNGDPGVYFTVGVGNPGSEWDGWALCDGVNGRLNLTDRFIVAGHLDNSDGTAGYSAGWQTKVTGSPLQTGGAKDHTLVDANLPEMTVNISGNHFDPLRNQTSDQVLIDDDWKISPVVPPIPLASFGQAVPVPVPTVPPFYAVAYVQFIGYT